MKRDILYTAIFLLISVLVHAQTVSVALYENADENSIDSFGLGESLVSSCMSELFNSGLIATSAHTSAIGISAFSKRADLGIREAIEGYIDFLIIVFIDFEKNPYGNGEIIPESIHSRFMMVSNKEQLGEFERRFEYPTKESAGKAPELCRAVGREIVAKFLSFARLNGEGAL